MDKNISALKVLDKVAMLGSSGGVGKTIGVFKTPFCTSLAGEEIGVSDLCTAPLKKFLLCYTIASFGQRTFSENGRRYSKRVQH